MSMEWKSRFAPDVFKTGPRLTAVLGYLFHEEWTEPAIAEMTITSDDLVMVRHAGECGFDHLFSNRGDMERNLRGAAAVVFDGEAALVEEFTRWAMGRIRGYAPWLGEERKKEVPA